MNIVVTRQFHYLFIDMLGWWLKINTWKLKYQEDYHNDDEEAANGFNLTNHLINASIAYYFVFSTHSEDDVT